MREITPTDLRNVTLKRRLRGYDRGKTEELLAGVAESYEALRSKYGALAEEMQNLRREQEQRESRFRGELDALKEELSARDRRIVDLETEIARYERERSTLLEEAGRLRKELAGARTAQDEDQEVLLEQRQRVARLETREKALMEQIAMFASQLEHEEPTQLFPARARALPQRTARAASMLVRFDRAVETLERETRREAELTLKKARERANEIVRAADSRRQQLGAESVRPAALDDADREEYDPVAALDRIERPAAASEAADPLESRIGEASWTSRASHDQSGANRKIVK
jgi:chromosome segregation ATPase